jgi:large subunit ribosomal protein L14e
VNRQQINFKALQLTSIVMKIARGLRPGNLAKAWEKQEVQKKWESTTWAKKIANKEKV